MKSGQVKAFAHITGGGLPGNVPRILPTGLAVKLDAQRWSIPPAFGWLYHMVSIYLKTDTLCTMFIAMCHPILHDHLVRTGVGK